MYDKLHYCALNAPTHVPIFLCEVYSLFLYVHVNVGQERLNLRLQLSHNLQDSPGFLVIVLGTGRHYCKSIVGPG